jgi:hypothetical protein
MFVQAHGDLRKRFTREFLLALKNIWLRKIETLHTFANSLLSIGI